jgi:2-methylcitrate dehydratase PrpD
MIIRRKAGITEFTDEFVQSSAVQNMMDRVEPIIDPEIDALGQDKLVSVIEVILKDGRILREKSSEHYRGGPQNPLSRDELVVKFNDCVQRILNPDQARKLLKTIDSLESLNDIHTLITSAAIP